MSFDKIVEQYENDGYFVIPELLNNEECEKLKTEAKRVFNEKARPDASVYVHASVSSPIFQQYHKDPRLVDILKKIMPDGVMFLSDKIVVKTSDKTFATPWHQDYFYWPNTRPKLSSWIALDDANEENGTLIVARASHKKHWTMLNKALPNGEFFFQVPDNEINNDDVVVCTVKRGSAIFFSDRLVHASMPNVARKERYTIISTYHAPDDDEKFDLDFPAREILVPKN